MTLLMSLDHDCYNTCTIPCECWKFWVWFVYKNEGFAQTSLFFSFDTPSDPINYAEN